MLIRRSPDILNCMRVARAGQDAELLDGDQQRSRSRFSVAFKGLW